MLLSVQGCYAVINEGSGYAIVNIQTKEYLARNITSFLDCVKTLEYIAGKATQVETPTSTTSPTPPKHKTPDFDVRDDVQKLIEKYAPNTVRVQKEVHWNRSKYNCFDASDNFLGKVKGKLGDRYWKDSVGNKHY